MDKNCGAEVTGQNLPVMCTCISELVRPGIKEVPRVAVHVLPLDAGVRRGEVEEASDVEDLSDVGARPPSGGGNRLSIDRVALDGGVSRTDSYEPS